jgi:hypothetical protein
VSWRLFAFCSFTSGLAGSEQIFKRSVPQIMSERMTAKLFGWGLATIFLAALVLNAMGR